MKKKILHYAIKTATASLILGSHYGAIAQETPSTEEQPQVLEEVYIIGSNIPRAIPDGSQPVTTISSIDIELSGITSAADFLRSSSINSFGSFRERSGSSFGQIATIDLRGLGASRTAVLVNGRRVPGSPLTGASTVDLNTIPISAIESIQVLKDSASAIYGADAIGGVVSIKMKDDFEGFHVGGGLERPSLEGADQNNVNFVFGKNIGNLNVIFGAEYYKRDAISDGDREYSRADLTGPDFNNTEGVSEGGNTAFEKDFSGPFALGDCDTSIYAGVFENPFGLGGNGCGFAFANISLQTGNLERNSFFLSSDYEINDTSSVYLDARLNQNKTSGRYAPAVGFFNFAESSPFNTFGRDLDVFHRFVGHGNRVDSVDIDELTVNGGYKLDFSSFNADIWFQYFDYSGQELGNTYVLRSVLEAEVAAGRYNVTDPLSQDPGHLAAIEASSAPLSRDLKTENLSFGATFNGTAFALPGGDSGWALGLEWADEEYTDIYDEFREARDVLGSAGNSAQGERTRAAIFGEFLMPLADIAEVTVAARFDDYDDFGSEFSPQIAGKISPTDALTLRASYGEGFKAPNLIDLYQELAESSDDLTDRVRCDAQGISGEDCPTFQVTNFSGGNASLGAEESESFNFGAILQIDDDISFSIDYFAVELNNAVTELSLDQVNDREAAGTLPPGVIINRGPTVNGVPGAVRDITNPLTNGAFIETDGFDINFAGSIDLGPGTFKFNLSHIRFLKYNEQTTPDSALDELLGTENGEDPYPDTRYNTAFGYIYKDLTVTLNSTYISSVRNVSDTDRYEAWLSHDVTLNYRDAFGLSGLDLTAGVLNFNEEEPSIDPTAGYNQDIVSQLYDVRGSVPFIKFKYRLGE